MIGRKSVFPAMNKMLRNMNPWIEEHAGFKTYAVLLLLVMAIAYKYQVWRLGIYYDDWEGVLLYKLGYTPVQIWNYFLIDRPFSSGLHILLNPILGAAPIGWHVLALLLNWGAIIFLLKTILHFLPTRTLEAGWIGLLLGVYPGMQRQFVVHTSAPHYTSMFLFALSIYLMVRAIDGHRHRNILLILSVLFAAAQMLFIEYFTGLELIRPLIIFLAYKKTGKTNAQALKSSLLMYIPFAVVFGGFLYYKLEFLPMIQLDRKGAKHQIELFDALRQNPVGTSLQYAQLVIQDALHATFYAWTLPIALPEINLQSKSFIASWIVGAIIAAISLMFIAGWQKKTRTEGQDVIQTRVVVLLAIVAFLLGGLPAWIIDRQALQGIWGDRFLFGQIFGAVPLTVLGIIWLTGQDRRKVQNLVFAILLTGAISLQMRTANKYALTWDLERSYFWQLKWRVPSLKENAFILSPYTPFEKNSAYQIAYAINIMYAPVNGREQLPVWWFDGPSGIIDQKLKQYVQRPIRVNFRSLTFKSDMTHALPVIHREGRGCLQVLDPIYEGEPLLNEQERLLFPVTNAGLVTTGERPMPTDVFGPEPPHDWCYYFQRADLAREFKQWDEVIRLWEEAGQKNLQAGYGPEYLPFIEAFAELGDWDSAGQLTLRSNDMTQNMAPLLCRNWERIAQNTADSPEKRTAQELIRSTIVCQP